MVLLKSRVSKVLMLGPLVPVANDLSSTLEASGYTLLTIANQLRLLAHVTRWMDGRGHSVVDLTDEVLEESLAAAHAAERFSLCSQGGLGHMLRALLIPPAEGTRSAKWRAPVEPFTASRINHASTVRYPFGTSHLMLAVPPVLDFDSPDPLGSGSE